MNRITTRQFNLLTDVDLAWDFLVEVYDANHVEAPYFEYAITESWMNKDYLHLCRFWLDGDKAVGFVFHENPVTNLHFALRPRYESLAEEMMPTLSVALPCLGCLKPVLCLHEFLFFGCHGGHVSLHVRSFLAPSAAEEVPVYVGR